MASTASIFKLHSKFNPSGDQPQAIEKLTAGLQKGEKHQVLLGITGSGKTFTMANLIANYSRPTLILAHNKTLAAQLYSEFRDFFPENAVEYFVSYFDYYQPEAYLAATDTYIEKDSAINQEIDRLRHSATVSLLTRPDTIIIASVSCIYGLGSPEHYTSMSLRLELKSGSWQLTQSFPLDGETPVFSQQTFLRYLVAMQYHRNDLAFERGNFRVLGDTIDLFPAAGEVAYRFSFAFDQLESVHIIDPLTATITSYPNQIYLFPNTHYATPKEEIDRAILAIRAEFDQRLAFFKRHKQYLAAERLSQRTKYDLEMLQQTGFVKGIENYSRHLEGRTAGVPPATLLDFFPKDLLLIVDESHMTLPQVRGMYHGDHARKSALVEYGFRLPSALDNRPLTFEEFSSHINQAVYVSATPGSYELSLSPAPVEQVIRPTGLLDPKIEIRPSEGQIDDLVYEIEERIKRSERILITTLTKRMAEDLTEHLKDRKIKTAYIHSDIDTLERGDILRDLRSGNYDVLVGINLLREGLDLPEVSLVAILDADKEGFLRSESALIQTIGRAARHIDGTVIMYADHITDSLERAVSKTLERRELQMAYNQAHHITPKPISKEINLGLRAIIPEKPKEDKLNLKQLPKEELPALIKELTAKMQFAASNLDFETAASLRDLIQDLKTKSSN